MGRCPGSNNTIMLCVNNPSAGGTIQLRFVQVCVNRYRDLVTCCPETFDWSGSYGRGRSPQIGCSFSGRNLAVVSNLLRMKLWKRATEFAEPIGQMGLFAERVSALKIDRSRVDSLPRLPSFFIIGPPRTGTSWLHEILCKRTVLPSPTKETRFFDTHFNRGFTWYRSHFPKGSSTRCMGEVAPTYFASRLARQRIAQYLPNAKVACIFRNPVERVVSLYRLKRAYGMIPWSFEQALHRDPELLESSRYVSNFKAWQQELGADQVLPLVYDDLRNSPQSFLDSVVDFVGVPRFQLTPYQIQYVHTSEFLTHPRDYTRTRSATMMADWFKARQLDSFVSAVKRTPLVKLFLGGGPAFAALPPETTQDLYQRFRPEVDQLETLLNRDLSTWKSLSEVA